MDLLKDIQAAAIDSTVPLPDLLRKCTVLAARLGHEEFKTWVNHELNGYQDRTSLPEYRVLGVRSLGDFAGILGSGIRNAPIPTACIPKEFRDIVDQAPILQPIGALVALLEGSKGESLRIPWPADLVAMVSQDIYQRMNCLSAWQAVSRGQIVGIVDTVRNRILAFVLELEAQAPDAGEWPSSQPRPDPEKVSHVFHTRISGSVGSVVTGSHDVVVNSVLNVEQGNLDSLTRALSSLGLGQSDLEQLRRAVTADMDESPKKSIGLSVSQWIAAVLRKASEGAFKSGAGVLSTTLIRLVLKYYGLE